MYAKSSKDRLSQGDVLENVEYKIIALEDESRVLYSITFPYIIVLTQDCDLEWDFENRNDTEKKNHDKFLQSVLFCPAYISEQFKEGQHLLKLNLTMATWTGDLWKRVIQNQHDRFHYLEGGTEMNMPNLIIDFKHYYTISRDEIYGSYKEKYKTSVETLYREQLSQRFAYYLSRIGLPTVVPS